MDKFEAAKQIAGVIAELPGDKQRAKQHAKQAVLMALVAEGYEGLLVEPAGLAFRTVGPSGPAEAAADVATETGDQE